MKAWEVMMMKQLMMRRVALQEIDVHSAHCAATQQRQTAQ